MTRGRSRWDFSGREVRWFSSMGSPWGVVRGACCVLREGKTEHEARYMVLNQSEKGTFSRSVSREYAS